MTTGRTPAGAETAADAGRLHSLDVVRGVAIVVMIVIHRVHYHWPGMAGREELRRQFAGWQAPVLLLVIAGLTMAGVFYVVSGAANAVARQRRVAAAGGRTGTMVRAAVLQGALLLAAHYLYRVFLVNGFVAGPDGGEPVFPIGQLNGWVRSGAPVPFRWAQITAPGTLFLLGASSIVLGAVLGLLLRGDGVRRVRRNVLVLGACAAAVLALYPPLAARAVPAYTAAYAAADWGRAFLAGHLALTFGLFPNLAFVFAGAAAGIALAGDVSPGRQRRLIGGVAAASILLAAAGALAAYAGGGGFSRKSPLTGFLAALFGTGVYLLILRRALVMYEWAAATDRERRLARYTWIRRLGRCSLTVYLLEPVLAELLNRGLVVLLGPGWSQPLAAVLAMGAASVLAWHLLLVRWQRAGFAGTAEWCCARILARVTGERGARGDFSDLDAPAADWAPVRALPVESGD